MRTAIYDLIDWFNNSFTLEGFNQAILPLKIVSGTLSVIFLVIIVILVFKIRKNIVKHLTMFAKGVDEQDEASKIFIESWQAILDRVNSPNEADYKMAVIEADKIFDDLLKRNGYKGEDMGGRLKQITQDQLPNIDEVWEAHKSRNRLVHEPDFRLNQDQAKRMIETYQRALRNLEASWINKVH